MVNREGQQGSRVGEEGVVRVRFVRSGGLAGLDLVATVDSGDLPGDLITCYFISSGLRVHAK